jgi:hypothetical protein
MRVKKEGIQRSQRSFFFVIEKRENTRGRPRKHATLTSPATLTLLLLLITPILITGSID